MHLDVIQVRDLWHELAGALKRGRHGWPSHRGVIGQANANFALQEVDIDIPSVVQGAPAVAHTSDDELHGEYWINKQYSAAALRIPSSARRQAAVMYALMKSAAASALMAFPMACS